MIVAGINMVMSMTSDSFRRETEGNIQRLRKFETESRGSEQRMLESTRGYQATQMAKWDKYFIDLRTKWAGNEQMLTQITRKEADVRASYAQSLGYNLTSNDFLNLGKNKKSDRQWGDWMLSGNGEEDIGGNVSARKLAMTGRKFAGMGAFLGNVDGPLGKITSSMTATIMAGELARDMFSGLSAAGIACGGGVVIAFAAAAVAISAVITDGKVAQEQFDQVLERAAKWQGVLEKFNWPKDQSRQTGNLESMIQQIKSEMAEDAKKLEELKGVWFKGGGTENAIINLENKQAGDSQMLANTEAKLLAARLAVAGQKTVDAQQDLNIAQMADDTARRRAQIEVDNERMIRQARETGTDAAVEVARRQAKKNLVDFDRQADQERVKNGEEAQRELDRQAQREVKRNEQIAASYESVRMSNVQQFKKLTGNHPMQDQLRFGELTGQGYNKSQADMIVSQERFLKLLGDAKSIYDSTRTPAEKYAETIAHIDDLYNQGMISAETYNRAVKQADGNPASERQFKSGEFRQIQSMRFDPRDLAGTNPLLRVADRQLTKLDKIEQNTRNMTGGFANN